MPADVLASLITGCSYLLWFLQELCEHSEKIVHVSSVKRVAIEILKDAGVF
jgi:hypothetical protein